MYYLPENEYNFEKKFEEDEPPLLEELGINPTFIMEKTLAVLNPIRVTDIAVIQDSDLAGPFLFCILFGFILLFSGKLHFGYIYGIGVMGCFGMYFLLNLMCNSRVSLGFTISVLGYCLLPMIVLALANVIILIQGFYGTIFTIMSVFWSSTAASRLFVQALKLENQTPLIAYPCSLLYGVFALLAIF